MAGLLNLNSVFSLTEAVQIFMTLDKLVICLS